MVLLGALGFAGIRRITWQQGIAHRLWISGFWVNHSKCCFPIGPRPGVEEVGLDARQYSVKGRGARNANTARGSCRSCPDDFVGVFVQR